MTLRPEDDPAAALAELAGARRPWLFGVRHHSPACAIALPPLLDAVGPDVVAIELPEDLGVWMEWLGHPEARAPLAVAAVSESGAELGFYPFADFSPELAAIRWARARGVKVVAIDLPSSRRPPRERAGEALGIAARFRGEDSWEEMVEGPAAGAEPERVRRAALLYGWALRLDAARGDGVGELDLAREAHMRAVIAAQARGGEQVAAVVGAFHAAALLPEPVLWRAPRGELAQGTMVSSLIPYAFELLDARSGYPAGIKDPAWQQRVWEASGQEVGALVARALVEITREIRARGLPASVPDAHAAAEMAGSLARLRNLPAPGRRELVEGVQSALTHGELLGRGRVVARAMESVLVGRARGALAPATPRSGLGPHVADLCAELGLPREGDLRLDPLRGKLDRRRHVALCRLRACGIPYATQSEQAAETLTAVWRLSWQPATEAMIELAGARGVTLRQAAAGALRAERARAAQEDRLGFPMLTSFTSAAADAGAGALVGEWLVELSSARLAEATLADLIGLLSLVDRIAAGHVVALPAAADAVPGEIDAFVLPTLDRGALLATAVASVLGLAGSESLDDAKALAELARVLERADIGDGRLRWSVGELVATGTPLIAGAAAVVQVLIGATEPEALSAALGGWLDAAVDPDGRTRLAARLRGALAIAAPLFEAAAVFLAGLMDRVDALPDADFLARVAALREGFEVLSNASRKRLLRVLGDRLGVTDARGHGLDVALAIPPALLAAAAEADQLGRTAMARVPRPDMGPDPMTGQNRTSVVRREIGGPEHEIGARDRWRMILGHEREQMRPKAGRAARALDELYGNGHGEGSREELGGGGQEAGFPTVREWREEIEALFGERVFEEVAGQAAARGRLGALLELDPEHVAPSVELLEQVLSLRGGLGEAQLHRVRALVRRIVDELVRELAVRVRPALVGTTSPRPTRRPGARVHLPRTLAANLAHVRRLDDAGGGDLVLVPETMFFKQRQRRQMDWHVVLVVDVSGSMEPSVIYSAMMAAILSAVPWLDVKFVAFTTEIIDLSHRVSDPLALLLEIALGGGTNIAKGLRYARGLVTVPARTIVVCLTDFEEGASVDALLGEVRALVEAGVTCLGLAALDDRGAPRYAVPIAEQVAAAGMPVAALTPLELARWIGDRIK